MTTRSFAEVELKERLEAHGYTLYGITHFKKHDRINFGNDKIKLTLKLRSKLSYFALDAIVNACIGKKESTESKE